MISARTLALMRCPHCHHAELRLGSQRLPALWCTGCEARYPIVDGIPDMIPPSEAPEPGTYRTETLANLLAGISDAGAPLLSATLWQCSPLRWVDSENRALGRANGGVYLRAPMGTGMLLEHALADYHDLQIVGIDRSWNMLRKAQRRLAASGRRVQLMRAEWTHLPLRDGVVDSIQSLNGLQIFGRRVDSLRELRRCLRAGGHISGSALIRGQKALTDAVLERLERYGVYPMLRTPEFLLQDLHAAALQGVHYETRGAVMFFGGSIEKQEAPVTDRARGA